MAVGCVVVGDDAFVAVVAAAEDDDGEDAGALATGVVDGVLLAAGGLLCVGGFFDPASGSVYWLSPAEGPDASA